MPILDAAPLNREDEDALRGILGPPARPPVYAEEMREAAHRIEIMNDARMRAARLMTATRKCQRAREALIRRLHSSV